MNTSKLVNSLPWEPNSPPSGGRTLLICDSIETDGRFVLHTIASQYLSQSKIGTKSPTVRNSNSNKVHHHVIWISCGSSTERQVTTALKKVGCDDTSPSIRSLSSEKRSFCFIHVANELATMLETNPNVPTEKIECYLKNLYFHICSWIDEKAQDKSDNPDANNQNNTTETPENRVLVVIDDLSSLSCLFSQLTTHAFLQKLSTSKRVSCIAARCSLDLDQEELTKTVGGSNHQDGGWVGAGGNAVSIGDDDLTTVTAWERSLAELADGIIDVIPLPSGVSREAHGRLVFTERVGGRGWCDHSVRSGTSVNRRVEPLSSAYVLNFWVGDSGVKATRLRAEN
mmetsp:Transcript_61130/g.72573  ORF Transcript_61130/g.72573 Transcript_61130/m.72573 type:complete len:341 (+) Transcript_61130:70-1092(+)|eukprot:CAMPEP_0172506496 /NCGR_PEP_ID=MMETSP1066-20121228/195565_1 /TAXON_ID=671091 /ORGANISM="Coscinodiscus wailesii, Strain CCMP2513" /LENGTH=340 /DNA_ID=CAMNT_0013283549 /DNA_START=65 /DNA_END=1087 /DNA_ORIENTATION=-